MKTALEAQIIHKIKEESLNLLILSVVFIIIFKIIFYQENLLILARGVISFFLTFILPGFILCYLWEDKLEFTERFIIGNIIGITSVGILSYNLSVYAGIHIKSLSIISPILIAIIFGLIVWYNHKQKWNLSSNISQY